ncbi:MAG: hypothetical protein ACFFBY_12070 [Promethearchaeota archaeon]
MSSTKVKESSTVLNILLILLGLVFLFKAVIEVLNWFGILLPGEWGGFEELEIFGALGLVSIALGVWSIIAGVGMFKEAKWALGIALVVLSIMVLTGIAPIVGWIQDISSFDYTYWPNYITLISFVIGIVGFFWLLFTRKRYV